MRVTEVTSVSSEVRASSRVHLIRGRRCVALLRWLDIGETKPNSESRSPFICEDSRARYVG